MLRAGLLGMVGQGVLELDLTNLRLAAHSGSLDEFIPRARGRPMKACSFALLCTAACAWGPNMRTLTSSACSLPLWSLLSAQTRGQRATVFPVCQTSHWLSTSERPVGCASRAASTSGKLSAQLKCPTLHEIFAFLI